MAESELRRFHKSYVDRILRRNKKHILPVDWHGRRKTHGSVSLCGFFIAEVTCEFLDEDKLDLKKLFRDGRICKNCEQKVLQKWHQKGRYTWDQVIHASIKERT
jgi:hypothetical protein